MSLTDGKTIALVLKRAASAEDVDLRSDEHTLVGEALASIDTVIGASSVLLVSAVLPARIITPC